SADMPISSGEVIGASNTAVPTTNAPIPVINGFYADNTPFGTTTPAFSQAPATYASTPGGDAPLKFTEGSGGNDVKTVTEDPGGTTSRDWRWELDGYAAYSNGNANPSVKDAEDYTNVPFNGYTQGPGYWGKTFFVWPPDPRIPLTTTYYTSNASLTAPGQIQSIVKQFMNEINFTSAQLTQINTTFSNNKWNYVWKNWATFTSASS